MFHSTIKLTYKKIQKTIQPVHRGVSWVQFMVGIQINLVFMSFLIVNY